jgi:hypothetical protein
MTTATTMIRMTRAESTDTLFSFDQTDDSSLIHFGGSLASYAATYSQRDRERGTLRSQTDLAPIIEASTAA